MSADNAIYIRPLKNGKYAVKCISSLYHEEMTDEEIDDAFSHSQLQNTLEDVENEVERIYDEYDSHGWQKLKNQFQLKLNQRIKNDPFEKNRWKGNSLGE